VWEGEPVIDTGGYLRFERVDSVRDTERGVLAQLHGEQLRIDLISDEARR
jgi:alpha-glucosidase